MLFTIAAEEFAGLEESQKTGKASRMMKAVDKWQPIADKLNLSIRNENIQPSKSFPGYTVKQITDKMDNRRKDARIIYKDAYI